MRPTPARARARSFVVTIVAAFALIVGLLGGVSVPAVAVDVSATNVTSNADAVSGIVKAADLSKFQAGRIIDDAVFYNSSTMTEAQIQTFLNQKVPVCQPGYTCLKDFKQTTTNKSKDQMCNGYTGGTNESAARIISKVAQSCGINPQVILVMLQKEQGLVTHVWPSSWRYDAALGQDCPDTPAGCSAAYKGFFSQIYGGMWQMKRYTNPPGTYNYFNWYPVGKTSQVRYNPDAACGSGSVRIENQATASLYYYTPYQPNAAAIRAGYGEGDRCSAYGNRNFFNYFNDWFGSTFAGSTPPVVPPTIPAFEAPTWRSTDKDGALYAVSGSDVWAYPLNGDHWGTRVKVASGLKTPKSVTMVGDLTGDGKRDLVVLNSAGVVSLLPGNGSAFSGTPRVLPIDGKRINAIYGAGDFDGDERSDIITRTNDGKLELWRGTRAGVELVGVIATGFGGIKHISAGIDFDGDGNGDVVGVRADGALMLYRGDGTGGFASTTQIGQGWDVMSAVVVSADITSDKKIDVIARNKAGNIVVYTTNGKGSFGPTHTSGTGWNPISHLASTGPNSVSVSLPVAGGASDLTRDGLVDLAAITATGELRIYASDGKGWWNADVRKIGAVSPQGRVFPMGDFDGDDRSDFGMVDASGLFWLYSSADLTQKPRQIGSGWAPITMIVGNVDFDGDGNPDVLARLADGSLRAYFGDGLGGWREPKLVGSGWNIFDQVFSAGDFDGDGTVDLIARTKDGALWLYPLDGKGSWGTNYQIGQGWQKMTAVVSAGDFNQDGNVDVFARTITGELLLYPGNGRGSWLAPRAAGTGWNGITTFG
ncbi:VCBS repeat-containing protein [Microbacterium sp. NC79]|uniref:FG-GAP repeat domain-containing protein n=1 Tax=Microbacterium sp. NC79 TaxID=2851009 RepID=UPI001C2BF17D|nr:VCBS repeat-containing protein [Microbacterium sp. NC79]MBV0894302.1 VCBS repeat-containing protein [Microbacterium sp. NC79]